MVRRIFRPNNSDSKTINERQMIRKAGATIAAAIAVHNASNSGSATSSSNVVRLEANYSLSDRYQQESHLAEAAIQSIMRPPLSHLRIITPSEQPTQLAQ